MFAGHLFEFVHTKKNKIFQCTFQVEVQNYQMLYEPHSNQKILLNEVRSNQKTFKLNMDLTFDCSTASFFTKSIYACASSFWTPSRIFQI